VPQPMSRTAPTRAQVSVPSSGTLRKIRSFPHSLVQLVIVCCLLVAFAVVFVLRGEYRQQLQIWQEKLDRIADANQHLLENWIRERENATQLLASFPCSARETRDAFIGSPLCERTLQGALVSVARAYDYAGAYVLDRAAQVIARADGSPPLAEDVRNQVAASSQPQALTISGRLGPAGYRQVAFVAPIRDRRPAAAAAKPAIVGYVVLVTRPGAIASLLAVDLGATATAETVLVASQAGQAVFVSPLRHLKNASTLPPLAPGNPGRTTLREKRSLFGAYRDYRGVQVLVATRFLSDTGWAMVSKVDREEALSGFHRTLTLGIFIGILSILTIVSVAAAWWRHERILRLQADLVRERHTEEDLRQSEERFWVALHNSPVIVFNQDRDLRYTWVHNPQPPWSGQEYLGKTDEEIIGVADGSRLSALKRPVLETGIGARKEWSFVWRGELRAYDVNIQPLRNEAGEITGITCASTDVSERKRAEERLREYEKVVEGLEEMILVVDRNYRYQIANRAFLEYRGVQREQLIGRLVPDVLNPGVFENVVKAKMDECFQGKVVVFEMKYTYSRLGERDLLISYFPIEGREGVDRIACVLQDITDRKRAERALRDSETRYRLLFERNPAGMFRSTVEGKLLEGNEAFARMFGYDSRDQIPRYPSTDFYRDPKERTPLAAKLREQGYLSDYELCGRRRDGNPVWVLANMAYVAGENGGSAVLEGTFIDITARKNAEAALQRSEAQLRAFVENAPYGIFRCAGNRFLSANPALVKMLGYGSEAELLKLNLADDVVYSRGECPDLAGISAQQGEFGPVEVSWKRRDGSLIRVHLRGRVASNGEKTIEAIAEDITQQRALEEYLSQSDRLEALGRLASGVAHDFNNLLLGITLNLEHVLQHNTASGSLVWEEIEQALHAARNAAAVTRQLLVFGRKRAVQRQSLNLNDVVIRSQDLVNRLAGESIHVNLRLSPNLDPVLADPVQVQQVILNLVANARDAMAGGGQITIATRTVELQQAPAEEYFAAVPKAGSYVVLEVNDTGSGIGREALTHIFEPFYTTKVEGSGLGLSTSYGIVSQSSGYISVRTQPGHGTTVRSYLPRQHEVSPNS
jgi:PAS domain S-box-containing protein